MLKVLLAIDGSENSLRAVSYLIKRASSTKDQYQVALVNVQYPLHGTVARFIDGTQVKQYHYDEGMKMLAPAETASVRPVLPIPAICLSASRQK